MKNTIGLFAGLILTAAINASAMSSQAPLPTVDSSWTAIRADSRVTIKQTAMAEAFGSNGFFNACYDGKVLRSIEPLKVCAKWNHINHGQEGGSEDICVQYTAKEVAVALNQTQQVCTQWQNIGGGNGQEGPGSESVCVKYTTVNFNLSAAPVFSVQYTKYIPHGQETGDEIITTELFKKAYSIPACK